MEKAKFLLTDSGPYFALQNIWHTITNINPSLQAAHEIMNDLGCGGWQDEERGIAAWELIRDTATFLLDNNREYGLYCLEEDSADSSIIYAVLTLNPNEDRRYNFDTRDEMEQVFWSWKPNEYYTLWVMTNAVTLQSKEDPGFKIQRSVGDPLWKVFAGGRYLCGMETLADANRMRTALADYLRRETEKEEVQS